MHKSPTKWNEAPIGDTAQNVPRHEPVNERIVMTADSVSRVLRVNRKTVYEMVRTRSIPGVVRMGRVLRFSRAALMAWLGAPKAG
jgi:excisionase family DNA binding protein